jgi:hypothetical protein
MERFFKKQQQQRPQFASKSIASRYPIPPMQQYQQDEDPEEEEEETPIEEEEEEKQVETKKRRLHGHHHHHHHKHKHRHPKKHQKRHEEDEVSSHDSDDETTDGSSSSSDSAEGDRKKKKKKTKVANKKLHDQMVARVPLPIFSLVLSNAQVRSCGRCRGCVPCGKCANCTKNARNEAERIARIRTRIETDTKFASLDAKKQMSLEKKKKKLKCTETVCEKSPLSSSRSKKDMAVLLSRKEKIDASLARIELLRSGVPIGGDDEAESLQRQENQLQRERAEINRRIKAERHSGLGEGHSYALRMMKINHRHMRSVAKELVSRGDQNDTGAQRRKNRDLAVKVLIQIATSAKDVLMGNSTQAEWDSAIERSKQFMTGGSIVKHEEEEDYSEEEEDDEQEEEEEEPEIPLPKISFFQ